jgi:hypothetical protein
MTCEINKTINNLKNIKIDLHEGTIKQAFLIILAKSTPKSISFKLNDRYDNI